MSVTVIQRDATVEDVYLDTQIIGSIHYGEHSCQWQPVEPVDPSRPLVPPLSGPASIKQAVRNTVLDMITRQMQRLERGQPLTAADCDPLHPDLQPYVDTSLGFKTLRHPLVYVVPYHPPLAVVTNEQYRHRSEYAQHALRSGNWASFISTHERPYRFDAFCEVKTHLADREYWSLLGDFWTDSENVHQNHNAWLNLWLSPRPGREHAMDEDEHAALAALPETVIVYRGTSRRDNIRSLSWTLLEPKALWFAKRYHRAGTPIYLTTARVRRHAVLAHFLGRNEAEIVINPRNLRNIQTRTLSV